MKIFGTVFFFIVLFTIDLTAQVINRIDGTQISADSLDLKIKTLMLAANVSGVAISVFDNNQPVYSKTFGLADVPKKKPLEPTSVMYGASLAKTVFAYIVMQLVQEKKLDLDKPLQSYLGKPMPEYKIKGFRRGFHDLKNDDRYKKLTARMCLTHTTGFPNWRWFEPDEKLKFKFEPGTRYSYSGEGLSTLQFVIEQITGKGLEELACERVFQPLGMTSTSYVWQKCFEENICYGHNEKGEIYDLEEWEDAGASGTMSTTLNDYTKFFTALINQKGISKAMFDTMTNLQVRIRSQAQFGPMAIVDGPQNDSIQLGYGLGVGVFKTPYGRAFFKEGHDEGWGHYSINFPEKGIGVLIMTNNDNGEGIFKYLLSYAIGDNYTPWQWENYIPYDRQQAEGSRQQ